MDFKSQLDFDIDDVFLEDTEFAVEVEIQPTSAIPNYLIKGIFDEAYEFIDVDSESGVSSVKPVIQIKQTIETEKIEQLDKIIINTLQYVITDIQPDGVGTYLLVLNLVG